MTGQVFEPLPWQGKALTIPEADEQAGPINLFVGGPRGNGKTTLAQLVILRFLVAYGERARALVVRPDTYRGASDFQDRLEELLLIAYGAGRVNRNRAEHTIRVHGGGSVEFSALDAGAISKFQGREFGLILADEAGNFSTLRHLDRLRSNLRSPGIPPRLVVIANPGGPAHAEIARRWVSGRITWRPFVADDGETWVYITAPMAENRHLDVPSYMRRLRAACGNDTALLEAWTSGSWSAISGAFFSDVLSDQLWTPAAHGDEWREILATRAQFDTCISIDWGWSAPSVALFGARASCNGARGAGGRTYQARSLIVIDELATVAGDDPNEGAGWPPQMLAEAVRDRCEHWHVDARGVIDDARGLDGSTLIEQFLRLGLVLERPIKDRASGWINLKAMMAATRDGDGDHPGLWISERCRYLAETLPILQRNPLRPEDVMAAPKQADHGADSLRYLANHEPAEEYVGGSFAIERDEIYDDIGMPVVGIDDDGGDWIG